MDKNGFIVVFLIFIFISTNCTASMNYHHLRKLIATDHSNDTTTPEVSPPVSPVNDSNTNPMNTEKPKLDKQLESQGSDQTNSSVPTPVDPKGSGKTDNTTKTDDTPSTPSEEENGNHVNSGNEKANDSSSNLGNDDGCEGWQSCMDQELRACIQSSTNGSKGVFLVVKNDGEIAMKVNVQIPDVLNNDVPAFEVPKHETKRVDISSIMGKSRELTVDSGHAKCVLPLVKPPVSEGTLINQLSFYSKQVTPVYAIYASFLVALLLGGTWACCRFGKRNQQNGIAYQELEMAIPESSSAVNADPEEGWDDNWDDDWEEESAVESPSGYQVRSLSSDGLVSRASKKDGWENDWDD